MSFLSRLFGRRRDTEKLRPLYDAVVAIGRDPIWYRDGQVPDTIDGRFDMIATILALVLIRVEQGGAETRADSALLAELFIADMDGNIRQLGTGDLIVGKRIGKMMGTLGGRIGAFRTAFETGEGLEEAVSRNIFWGAPPSPEANAFVAARIGRFHAALAERPMPAILSGDLPRA